MKLHAVVVLYNRSCQDSETCRALLKQGFADTGTVILYDNSETDFKNRDYCVKNGWVYLGGNGNQGLSRAYNQSLEYLSHGIDKHDLVCLFDDDTELPVKYSDVLKEYAARFPEIEVFIPVLTQKGRIISPWREVFGVFPKYYQSIDECRTSATERMLAFNSCMAVRFSAYSYFHYDERQFLDGVDYAFLREIRRVGKKIAVINCECEHGFSGGQSSNNVAALKRYNIYAKDFAVLYENEPIKFFLCAGKRAVHLCVQYQKIEFLKVFILLCRRRKRWGNG